MNATTNTNDNGKLSGDGTHEGKSGSTETRSNAALQPHRQENWAGAQIFTWRNPKKLPGRYGT